MSCDKASASSARTRSAGASPRNSLVSDAIFITGWISCYDALVRACLEERAQPIVAEWSGVNRRPGTDVGAVDIAQAVAANAAKFTVAAGIVGEHLDGFDRVSPQHIPAHIRAQDLTPNAGFLFNRGTLLGGNSRLLPLINNSRPAEIQLSRQSGPPARDVYRVSQPVFD